MFLISIVLSLVCVCVVFFCCCCLSFLETTEGWFFQRIHLHIWAVAGHELSSLNVRAHRFNSWIVTQCFWVFCKSYLFSPIIKQVRNSLSVHDNSWTLKFNNISEFQNVISGYPQRASLWLIVYENWNLAQPLMNSIKQYHSTKKKNTIIGICTWRDFSR